LWQRRFVRFLVVGGVNTVFAYVTFALLIWAYLPYPLAALLATIASILFNFKSYGVVVFGSHDRRLIFRFVGVYVVCYVIGLLPLAWARRHGVPVVVAAAVGAVPMALLAFTLQRYLVFGRAPAPAGSARLQS